MKDLILFALCIVSVFSFSTSSVFAIATDIKTKQLPDDEILINIPNANGKAPFKITCKKDGNPDDGLMTMLWDDKKGIEDDLYEEKNKDVQFALDNLPLDRQIMNTIEIHMAILEKESELYNQQLKKREAKYESLRGVLLPAIIFYKMQIILVQSQRDKIDAEWQAVRDLIDIKKKDIAQAFKSPKTISLEADLLANTIYEKKARDFCSSKKRGNRLRRDVPNPYFAPPSSETE